jgi:hypothetical protein
MVSAISSHADGHTQFDIELVRGGPPAANLNGDFAYLSTPQPMFQTRFSGLVSWVGCGSGVASEQLTV